MVCCEMLMHNLPGDSEEKHDNASGNPGQIWILCPLNSPGTGWSCHYESRDVARVTRGPGIRS
jgi:hypothetical protein